MSSCYYIYLTYLCRADKEKSSQTEPWLVPTTLSTIARITHQTQLQLHDHERLPEAVPDRREALVAGSVMFLNKKE